MDNNNLVNDLSGILDGLDSSQEQLEKDAFDVINSSDTSLNLVKESISSVEEILKMIDELNEIAEESATRIRELEKLSKTLNSLPVLYHLYQTEPIYYRSMLLLRQQEQVNMEGALQ